MNKIIVIIILIFTHHLSGMKRSHDSISVAIQPKKKNKNNQPQAITAPSSSTMNIYSSQNVLAEQCRRLFFLEEEVKNLEIQIFYVNAIQQRNIHDIWLALAYGPKRSCLELVVGLKFSEGIDIILEHTQPTANELTASLEMAIGSQNISLINKLLKKGAHLSADYQPVHPIIRKTLRENKQITDIIATHNIRLADAVKMELETVVKVILKKTKLHQSELNESLEIAAQQHNELFVMLLREAGATHV